MRVQGFGLGTLNPKTLNPKQDGLGIRAWGVYLG